MGNDTILRERVTLLIQQGKLPSQLPQRAWGGPGVNATCAVCDRPIPKTELELEVEFVRGPGAPGLDVFHVHTKCYAVWAFVSNSENQCEQRGKAP
jgi:hypothetical protein